MEGTESDVSQPRVLYTQAVDPFPGAVRLGGVMDHLDAIRRCRRVLFVGCGTSYHACMACRQTIEQLTNMPVRHCEQLPCFSTNSLPRE
jgi:glucosamine 6-phosphate synthetase-like amidotransferase/phosphosugar isomerase protein